MKGNIDKVIAAILNGTATEIERKAFNEWIQESKQNQKIFESLKKYLRTNDGEVQVINKDNVRNRIWVQAHKVKHTKSRLIHSSVYRVAAAFAFLLIFAFLFRGLYSPDNNEVCVAKKKTIEKKNPVGIKSQIHLPDGSIVYLNAESSIKFTEGFQDSVRWVKLTGEAFFDVHKNLDKPFIVQSGDVLTQALGTSFNINAYHDHSSIDVSLVTGKVKVHSLKDNSPSQSILLEPGRHVLFQNSKIVDKGLFEPAKVIGWKDGIIVFENADYHAVVKKLERWYGVTIENEGRQPTWNLNAKFDNSSLRHILDVLSHSEQFKYSLCRDTVKIIIK